MNTNESTTPALNRAGRRSLARTGSALGGAGVLVAGSAAALLTAFAGSAGAVATTITVDSNGDGIFDATHCTDLTPGNCTLRDAAAAAVDGDTITFDASISLITLTAGTVRTTAVNIIGPGASSLTITTTAAPDSYDLFYIGGTGNAILSGLTITKNRVYASNDGKFTLDGVTVSGSTSGDGGALYAANDGELEIIDSTFENNTATGNGGAIYIYNGEDATISGSTFTNNQSGQRGGAIYTNWAQNITIIDCTITGNSSSSHGGGLSLDPEGGVVSIIDTTIDSNQSGASGGGLDVHSFAPLTVNISNSTVSNNTALSSAGLNFNSHDINATINNSTITANAATYSGGGIFIDSLSTLVVNQSTISANSSGGISQSNGGGGGIAIGGDTTLVALLGTIVSGNTSTIEGFADIALYDTASSGSASFQANHSLIGEVDPRVIALGTDNLSATDPMLGALADHGGATKTMALLTGSPAIDAGPSPVASFTGNEFDQRGTGYARVVGGLVDIGAFEIQPPPAPTTTTTAGTDEPVAPAFTG